MFDFIFNSAVKIKTAQDLSNAITSTYLMDITFAIIFIVLLLLFANLIKWQSGKFDNSGKKRKTVFFILLACTFFVSLLLNMLCIKAKIAVPAFANKYMTHMFLGAFVSALIYGVAGFVLVKLAPIGSKLQSIFPKKQ